MVTDSSKNLSASPGSPLNQFENLNSKSSKLLGLPFHSFGRPRLLSDPTPSVHTCVNSARESSGTAGTFPSTGIGVCRAAAAASVSPSSAVFLPLLILQGTGRKSLVLKLIPRWVGFHELMANGTVLVQKEKLQQTLLKDSQRTRRRQNGRA